MGGGGRRAFCRVVVILVLILRVGFFGESIGLVREVFYVLGRYIGDGYNFYVFFVTFSIKGRQLATLDANGYMRVGLTTFVLAILVG